MRVRAAASSDTRAVAGLRKRLWPEGAAASHRREVAAILSGRPRSTLPLALFVAEQRGRVIGFVEVGLRSHAEGCDPIRPCGFVEGWFVAPAHRRRGVGRALVERAEAWARGQGAREMASDTWLRARVSRAAHLALGYEVAERAVHFRKELGGAAGPVGRAARRRARPAGGRRDRHGSRPDP